MFTATGEEILEMPAIFAPPTQKSVRISFLSNPYTQESVYSFPGKRETNP